MRVQFHNGQMYDYYGVDAALFEQMLLPHPWHRVGRLLMAHRYRRAA